MQVQNDSKQDFSKSCPSQKHAPLKSSSVCLCAHSWTCLRYPLCNSDSLSKRSNQSYDRVSMPQETKTHTQTYTHAITMHALKLTEKDTLILNCTFA